MQTEIYIISTGPGHPDLLTNKAVKALEKIDFAVGSGRFESWVNVPFNEPTPLVQGTIDFIKAKSGFKIGVLVTGDAGFFSLAKSIIKEFGKENVKIIEGISIVQAAFASIAETWDDAIFLSAHGRSGFNAEKALNSDKFLILCDKDNNPKKIIQENSRLLKHFDVYVAANLSLENEIIRKIDLITPIPSDGLACVIGIRKEQ